MKAEHVNAFLVPSIQVLKKMARVDVKLGRIDRLEEVEMDDNLSIVIGLQGRLSGSVILTARRGVAYALAGRIAGEEFGDADEVDVRAILAEVANTIVGNATGHLYEIGVKQGITPPTVVTGPQVYFDFGPGVESARVPLETDMGGVEMIVSLTRETP
jgi:CheY-specific phosphatase CheX